MTKAYLKKWRVWAAGEGLLQPKVSDAITQRLMKLIGMIPTEQFNRDRL